MSGWRTKLRKASFRGIRFNLTDSDSTFGRRIAEHEFPKRDEPYSEDLGRKAQTFSFEAYINGFEYFRQRDKLVAACNKEGPGKLVHPYLGSKTVVCTECNLRESAREGGMALFKLSFREAGSLQFPAAKTQPNAILSALGLDLAARAVDEFTKDFDVAQKPQWVVDQASETVEAFADALETSTNFITRNADSIADLAFAITDLRDDIQGLLNAPSILAERMKNAVGLLKDSIFDNRESLDAFKKMYAFKSGQLKGTRNTVLRAISNKNINAVENFTKRLALANSSQVIGLATFTSIEDAETERGALFDAIDEQHNVETISDEVYQNLQQLRAELKRAVPPPDEQIPDVIAVTPRATTNSIILAYDLYDSLDKEQDIVDRNKIAHPGFIPGGDEIKVLFDG